MEIQERASYPKHRTATERRARSARQEKIALQLLIAGASFARIREELERQGLAVKTDSAISKIVDRAISKMTPVEDVARFRRMMFARYEEMLLSVYPQATVKARPGPDGTYVGGPDLLALDRAMRIVEHERRLLGLDAPTQIQIGDLDPVAAEEAVDAELRAEFERRREFERAQLVAEAERIVADAGTAAEFLRNAAGMAPGDDRGEARTPGGDAEG